MKRTDEREKKNRSDGFTLVELAVSLAVMTVLLSLSVWGVLAWQDQANFTRQEETAQALFATCSEAVARLKETGTFDEWREELPEENGRLRLVCAKGDYRRYQAQSLQEPAETVALFSLLEAWNWDMESLDAAVLVEVDVLTGRVVSVAYSDLVDALGEGTAVDITEHSYYERKEAGFGWYGTEGPVEE